jgi:hypothetical protein
MWRTLHAATVHPTDVASHACLPESRGRQILSGRQLPRPWDDESEHRLVQDALVEVEAADRLGY